jgi:hypothetical protein
MEFGFILWYYAELILIFQWKIIEFDVLTDIFIAYLCPIS